MKREVREIIYKVKPIHILAKYVAYNNSFYYNRLYKQYDYDNKFKKLQNRAQGRRCFIVGNGPSLQINDLDILIKEDCFASNEIWKVFDSTKWRPRYYFLQERYSTETLDFLMNIDAEYIFLSDYYCRFHKGELNEKTICLNAKYCLSRSEMEFSEHIEKYYIMGSTVSYMAMQVAVYLGYKEIYLIGFDNSYKYEIDKNGRINDTGKQGAHFYQEDDPKANVANIYEMGKCYEAFRKYAKSNGIVVKNLTDGGNLDIFERDNLESVLRSYI